LFIVTDGHGGDKTSRFINENFESILKKQSVLESNDELLFSSTLQIISDTWDHDFKTDEDGSTFIGMLINYITGVAIIMNLGDSKLCMYDKLGNLSFEIIDHDFESRLEMRKLYKRSVDHGLPCHVSYDEHETKRLNDSIALSRAIGDNAIELKGCIGHKPTIYKLNLKNNIFNYIVVASDGLWDELSPNEVGQYISHQ
jgi:serine/threonine protein phosphatase PrpC